MKRIITAILLAAILLTACAACGGSAAGKENPAAAEPVTVTLLVTMPDGSETAQQITTAKQTLGEALRDEGLIECDETGMIVKVKGVEASWEADQAYWSFEIDGVYATHGVDDEMVAAGMVYALKYTKG